MICHRDFIPLNSSDCVLRTLNPMNAAESSSHNTSLCSFLFSPFSFLSAVLTTNLGLIKAWEQRRDPKLHDQSSVLEKQERETMLSWSTVMGRFSVKVFHRTSNSRSESCPRELLKQWGFRGPKATDTRPGTKGIEIPKFPALWVNRLQAPVHSGTEQHPFPAALGEVRAWIPCAGASCSEQSRVRTVISP